MPSRNMCSSGNRSHVCFSNAFIIITSIDALALILPSQKSTNYSTWRDSRPQFKQMKGEKRNLTAQLMIFISWKERKVQ